MNHEQCYVLNLKKYKEYECPEIGDLKEMQSILKQFQLEVMKIS